MHNYDNNNHIINIIITAKIVKGQEVMEVRFLLSYF